MRTVTNYTRNVASRCVSARINRGGQTTSEHFGLAEYKTWKAAEKAAAAWVRRVMPSMPAPIPTKNRMTKRNSSGIVGVQLRHSVKASRWEHWAWKATWPSKPGGICWGIEKYGNEEAFVRAVIARKLETTDRDVINRKFSRLKGKSEYRQLVKLKEIDPP